MAWVKIDDQFPDHPKIAACGPLGMALQVAALCYCGRFLTDGFIPTGVAIRLLHFEDLAEPEDVIQRLVDAGVWVPVAGGYQIHDYLEYQPSRAQVEETRKKKAEAGRRGGQARVKADSKQSARAQVEETRKKKAEAGRRGGQARGKADSKQSAKQDAKQSASNELGNRLSKNEAKVNPVPVPDPIPLIKEKESKKEDAREDSEPTDSLSSPSDDLKRVAEHYHQVIGLLSPVAFQKLQFWCDEQGMEADVVCAAIDTTREQAERPGIAYLEGVLRNWRNEGVTTAADLEARSRADPRVVTFDEAAFDARLNQVLGVIDDDASASAS